MRQIVTACGARVNLRLVSFQHANEDVERMLLGNKCDMEDKRVVPRAKGEQVSGGQKLAYQSKLTFFRHPLSYLSSGSLVRYLSYVQALTLKCLILFTCCF